MAYTFQHISVLVVENNRKMSDLIRSVLETFGMADIHLAYSAEEGFEAFCAHEPDFVILDWLNGPDNGLALTRRIRTDSRSPNPFVPIILMTGYSLKKRILAARDSGVTEILVKPFTAQALYHKIEQTIEHPRHFVVTESYLGPDRRRTKDHHAYNGDDRRAAQQPVPADVSDSIGHARQVADMTLRAGKKEDEA